MKYLFKFNEARRDRIGEKIQLIKDLCVDVTDIGLEIEVWSSDKLDRSENI